jgi:hypothetical protein
MQWIQENVIQLVIVIVAAFALGHGRNGNIAKVITMLGTLFIGLIILALANPTLRNAIIDWFTSLIVNG